jgi:hypothetical protein
MAGNKHYDVLADIAEAMGDDIFDDRGVQEAVERLARRGLSLGGSRFGISVTSCMRTNASWNLDKVRTNGSRDSSC